MFDPIAGLGPGAFAVMACGLLVGALARGDSGFGFSAVLVASWSLVGMWLGGRHFLGASPAGFRQVTLALLVLLGLAGIARVVLSRNP